MALQKPSLTESLLVRLLSSHPVALVVVAAL